MNTVENTAVVDLLGVLAYAELTAFDRLAEDARLAPTLSGARRAGRGWRRRRSATTAGSSTG